MKLTNKKTEAIAPAMVHNMGTSIIAQGAMQVNRPIVLDINQDFSVKSKIQRGKVTVIVLDGINGEAYEAEAPEHGKTIIETAKGDFSKIQIESSYKFR
ncbi:XtrA/YqaO family protein [Bacillus paralicheniformis]|uniref:XtrA/YqaO family protein n=1 Tax=Bacillus paralicheniformis TaxID=1648923 RepID=UPI0035A282FA